MQNLMEPMMGGVPAAPVTGASNLLTGRTCMSSHDPVLGSSQALQQLEDSRDATEGPLAVCRSAFSDHFHILLCDTSTNVLDYC